MQRGGRGWQFGIEDILEALTRIARYVSGMTFETFCADKKTADAVERNLEIIGEASNNVPEALLARYPEVPWHRMRGCAMSWSTSTSVWTRASSGIPCAKTSPRWCRSCSIS